MSAPADWSFGAWLKRSRWSLAALVIAIPVAIVATFSVGWFQYLDSTVPHPRLVTTGHTVTHSKVKFELTGHRVVEADSDEGQELGALAGTQVVIVTLHVDATALTDKDLIGCDFDLAAPGPEGERHWSSDQFEVSLPYGGDDYQTSCALSDHNAFTLMLAFVVPKGTADDVSLQLTTRFGEPPALQWDW